MNEPEVTVLVAVYNTEAYLPKCLDSLLGQTLRSIQVVCVDDASTDRSLEILRRYQERDERVEVLFLSENHGQAYARNRALERARGKYICFLDSDDWMSPDCLERAVEAFENHEQADCVLFNTIYYYSEERQETYRMAPFEVMSGYDAFVKSLTWQIHGVYIVRSEIHRRHPYDDSAHSFSDDNTTRLHYLASREVRTCAGTYYYRQHAASVSHRFDLRRFDYLKANLSMKKTLQELKACDELIDVYENHRWLNVIDLYMLYYRHRHLLPPSDAADALRLMREAWQTIETNRLTLRNRLKFGYIPFKSSWFLFRLQEETYFGLRKWLGR